MPYWEPNAKVLRKITSFPVTPTTFLAAENFDFPVIGNLIFSEDLSLLLTGSAGLSKH